MFLSTQTNTGAETAKAQKAPEFYWSRIDGGHETSEKSRFTYQRKGNSEAHLSDVVKYCQRSDLNSYDVAPLVNDLLLNRVYPWIRASYLSREEIGNDMELFVYDSLVSIEVRLWGVRSPFEQFLFRYSYVGISGTRKWDNWGVFFSSSHA